MKKFEVIDISGDVGIRAYGESLEQAFTNTAIGMYSLITDIEGVKEKKTIDISLESHSLEGLLVSWLNELIFQFDTYGFIGKDIDVKEMGDRKIKASVSGEEFDPERHERKLLVKAATYHRVKVEKVKDMWEVDVIFDI